VAIGYQSGYSNTTGSSNTFAGRAAGYSNTTGSDNTFAGRAAGYSNTTGSSNTFAGYAAGRFQADGTTALTDAENSVYVGNGTRGYSNADNNTIVIGDSAIGAGANTAVLGNSAITDVYFGSSTGAARLWAKSLGFATGNPATTGAVRINCTGTTPSRTCSVLIYDGGAVRTIATGAAF
jgi:hypothetical protein